MTNETQPRIRHAKVVLPILAIGLALTGATAYAADATTTGNGILSRFGIELTDEQKAAMDQIRELRASGKTEEARALAHSVGFPARGPGRGHGMGMGGEMKAAHDAMVSAIESNDYTAFKAATVDAPFADKVDEAFFAKMVQVHNLHQSGNITGAHALLKELGVEPLMGMGHGMHGSDPAHRDAMRTAIENNDYTAFKAATVDAPFADKVDEAFFAKMVQAHTLRQSGDTAGADAIMTDLGFPQPGERHGHGMMRGGMFLRGAHLTDTQKAQLEEARALFQNGKSDEAKAIMDAIRAEVKAASTTTN